ncbi:MAG TPA: hypothetical protein PKN64_05775, partial [Casimicrobium sp.]|nr:hypothetical protein [Casimicrobium sp.]
MLGSEAEAQATSPSYGKVDATVGDDIDLGEGRIVKRETDYVSAYPGVSVRRASSIQTVDWGWDFDEQISVIRTYEVTRRVARVKLIDREFQMSRDTATNTFDGIFETLVGSAYSTTQVLTDPSTD